MAALGTRLLKVKIGSTEFTAELLSAKITNNPADDSLQTFAAAATGGARVYAFEFTAVQDPGGASSLWTKANTSAGQTAAIVYNPYGVTTATATTPFYSGNVIITEPTGDYLGGDADQTVNKRFTYSCVWELDAKPTAVTTGTF